MIYDALGFFLIGNLLLEKDVHLLGIDTFYIQLNQMKPSLV